MKARRWLSWGASVIGPAHRREGIPNQDAWMARSLEHGVAAAVSDGVGSCSHAAVGARAACRAVLEAASLHFRHPPVTLAGMPLLVQDLWQLKLAGRHPTDCSATCLFVAGHREVGVLVAQLGDGLIAACAEDGAVDLLMPDKRETFANLTVGLATEDAAASWRILTVPEDRYRAFVLCTDGIAEDLEPERLEQFARAVSIHYSGCSRRACRRDVRSWLEAWPVPGHTDDKTIVCIYRGEGDA